MSGIKLSSLVLIGIRSGVRRIALSITKTCSFGNKEFISLKVSLALARVRKKSSRLTIDSFGKPVKLSLDGDDDW